MELLPCTRIAAAPRADFAPVLSPFEHAFLSAVSSIARRNSFLTGPLKSRRQAFGEEFSGDGPIRSLDVANPGRIRGNTGWILRRPAEVRWVSPHSVAGISTEAARIC